jgi:hypothetical protein
LEVGFLPELVWFFLMLLELVCGSPLVVSGVTVSIARSLQKKFIRYHYSLFLHPMRFPIDSFLAPSSLGASAATSKPTMWFTIIWHAFAHLRHSSAHAFMCLSS